ncbi:hypothetical protein [Nostoc sp.]|uniref:hypothetical protein n=1 Tax=Nostoc sp. TaxID=1180 RepID=UPI002FF51C3F
MTRTCSRLRLPLGEGAELLESLQKQEKRERPIEMLQSVQNQLTTDTASGYTGGLAKGMAQCVLKQRLFFANQCKY